MDRSGELPRSQQVMSLAWEGVGLYARAEAQVDRLVESYTWPVPEELRGIVLKGRLTSQDRLKALRFILKDTGLTQEYPDLASLFDQVFRTRNLLAHGHLIYVAPEEDDEEVDPTDLIREGLGVMGAQGQRHISTEELGDFHAHARRLVGLLNTLTFELNAQPDGAIVDLLGRRVRLESPREPLGYGL